MLCIGTHSVCSNHYLRPITHQRVGNVGTWGRAVSGELNEWGNAECAHLVALQVAKGTATKEQAPAQPTSTHNPAPTAVGSKPKAHDGGLSSSEQSMLHQKLLMMQQDKSTPRVKSTLMAAAAALKPSKSSKRSMAPSSQPGATPQPRAARKPEPKPRTPSKPVAFKHSQVAPPKRTAPATKATSKPGTGWTTWSLDSRAGKAVKEAVSATPKAPKPAPAKKDVATTAPKKTSQPRPSASAKKATPPQATSASRRPAAASPLHSSHKTTSPAPRQPAASTPSPVRSGPESHKLHSLQSGPSPMYTCYCCGGHFHYASYHMHVGQCVRKWERSLLALQADDGGAGRPAPPPLPKALKSHLPTEPEEVAAFNEEMRKHREVWAMRHCGTCSKQVSVLLFARHQKHCAAAAAEAAAGGQNWLKPKYTAPKVAKKPSASAATRVKLAYTCYVCSDSFNAMKYHSHVDACRKRFQKQELVCPGWAVRLCGM